MYRHWGVRRRTNIGFYATIRGEMAILFSLLFIAAASAQTADVIVYGGTPGGLAAAASAVREGVSVILVEPGSHIGGMITGGIAVTDTGTPQFVGGLSREFFEAVAEATGPSKPAFLLFHGKQLDWRTPRRWDLEPKIAKRVFEKWVQQGGYKLIVAKRVTKAAKRDGRIIAITLTDGSVISGKVFLDASYEGDLMAKAGVSNTYGRESSAAYNEKLAGIREPHFVKNYTDEEYRTPTIAYMHQGQFGADIPPYGPDGRLLWGIEKEAIEPPGSADKRLQAYCFRLISTQREDLKLPWPKPDHYYLERYALLEIGHSLPFNLIPSSHSMNNHAA
jgi:FAD dependent oxidoreductase